MAGKRAGATPKVMHVITSLETGGAERMLERLVLAHRERPVSFHVVSLLPGGAVAERLRAAGIPVTALGMRRGRPDPRGLFRLARLIRRVKPDVVQSWLYHADILATVALLWSGRRRRTKLFWSVRCSSMESAQRSFAPDLARGICVRLSRRADVVVANSHVGRDFHQALGYRPRRFLVIDNGIDTDQFRPDSAARSAVRAELGIADGKALIAMIARLDPVKDYDTFLRALEFLPEVSALAVGGGTETLPARPGLYRLGERRDVARLLPACDVVVSTSLSEGFPNSVLEAMAAGVPVVATDAGDSRRILGDTGIIVPPVDPGAVAVAVRQLLGESSEARQLRKARARERAIEHFAISRMVEAYDALYREA